MTKEEAQVLHKSAVFLLQDTKFRVKNSWGKMWVEAEKPIPKEFKSDFYDELTSNNVEYRHALEESIRWFGVRWEK
jgi:hypothetical protein